MSLAFTLRANDPDAIDATSYSTPTFTPSPSAGIIVCVQNSKAVAPDKGSLNSPTWLDGIWLEEADQTNVSSNNRFTIFSGRTVSSPGSDLLTASFGATQTGCNIQAFDITGVIASDFALQPKSAALVSAVGSGSLFLDNAVYSSNSACVGFIATNDTQAHVATGGETVIVDNGYASPGRHLSCQYRISAMSTSASWPGVNVSAIMAVLEVKAPASGDDPPIGFIGRGVGW